MLIELENVTKTYGKVTALQGLSVALPEGPSACWAPTARARRR